MKIGDKVKVVVEWSQFYDTEGVITEYAEESAFPYTVEYVTNKVTGNTDHSYFAADELELVL